MLFLVSGYFVRPMSLASMVTCSRELQNKPVPLYMSEAGLYWTWWFIQLSTILGRNEREVSEVVRRYTKFWGLRNTPGFDHVTEDGHVLCCVHPYLEATSVVFGMVGNTSP